MTVPLVAVTLPTASVWRRSRATHRRRRCRCTAGQVDRRVVEPATPVPPKLPTARIVAPTLAWSDSVRLPTASVRADAAGHLGVRSGDAEAGTGAVDRRHALAADRCIAAAADEDARAPRVGGGGDGAALDEQLAAAGDAQRAGAVAADADPRVPGFAGGVRATDAALTRTMPPLSIVSVPDRPRAAARLVRAVDARLGGTDLELRAVRDRRGAGAVVADVEHRDLRAARRRRARGSVRDVARRGAVERGGSRTSRRGRPRCTRRRGRRRRRSPKTQLPSERPTWSTAASPVKVSADPAPLTVMSVRPPPFVRLT